MKILHIANFGFNKQGKVYYSMDRKISAGLIENGHFVYDFSFRDMARMGTIFKTKKLGANWASREVLKIVDNIEPELILVGHSDLMHVKVLQSVKQHYPHIKIAFWYVDPLYIQQKLYFIKEFSPYLDAIFCTTGGEYLQQFKQPHLTVAYMPNIGHANVEVLQQFNQQQFLRQMIFCGSTYKELEREQFLSQLGQALAQKQITYQYYGCFGTAGIYGKDYYRVLATTQMGLNYSRRNDITLYTSDRIVQLTGNGLLTLSPKIPKFELLYDETELVYFDNQHDLAEKIDFYHSHREQANQIAQAGWQKTKRCFNAKRITQFMLETIFKQPYSESYEWSSEVY